jgi:ATP-dependent Clp protease ATP-binding subunit ClpA
MLNQFHSDTCKLSFVLFDEIEKASDALWNLLLGVLDKGTLTLGDNRKVDFSKALIFMTSNLGAAEMSSLINPRLGFRATAPQEHAAVDEKTTGKLARTGVEAARRKFTPEFINRLDKIVTFRPLGEEELRKILDIELRQVQQRIFNTSLDRAFVFQLTNPARDFLLTEGTDLKYGARHLKRAIERHLVQPIANLIATDQILGGDCVKVDFDAANGKLTFLKQAQGMEIQAMAEMTNLPVVQAALALANAAVLEAAKTQSARTTSKR